MKQAEAEAEGEEGVKEEEEEVEDRKISIAKVGRQWYPQRIQRAKHTTKEF
jgi:hypothetical protein